MIKTKILVTGSTGMVGKALLKRIFKIKKYQILNPNSKQLDLMNSKSIKNYLIKNKPTHIIHLAGYVGGINASITDPINFLYKNTLISHNLIYESHSLKIKNFINLGSSCIYPSHFKNKINEKELLNGRFEETNEGYAIAKVSSIKLCEYISKKFNYNYLSLIPSNIYGPYDKFDIENGHIVGANIKKISSAIKTREKYLEIWGSGKCKRELIYVDDVADAIIFFLNKNLIKKKYLWVNIGTGEDHSVNYIVKLIGKEFKYNGKYFNNLKKPDGIFRKLLDINLAKKYGWRSRVNLEKGIKKTVKWYSIQK